MKGSILARLILAGFLCIFLFAGAYLLLDSFGVWPRIPAAVTRSVEVGTGLILLFALLAHLLLATGAIPAAGTDARGGP